MNDKAQIILDLLQNNVEREDIWSQRLKRWRDKAASWLEHPNQFGEPPSEFREACLEAARVLADIGIEVGEHDVREALTKRRRELSRSVRFFGRPKRLPLPIHPNSSLQRNALLAGLRSANWFGPCSARG